MADNQQNTYAGGAGALATPTGNGILDGFLKLSNVAVQTFGNLYGVYDSVRERELAATIARQNAANPPQQNLPASTIRSAADYVSDPENVQKLFLYSGISILLIVGSIYAFKKVV